MSEAERSSEIWMGAEPLCAHPGWCKKCIHMMHCMTQLCHAGLGKLVTRARQMSLLSQATSRVCKGTRNSQQLPGEQNRMISIRTSNFIQRKIACLR